MKTSYAVTWRNGTRRPAVGKLEIGVDAIRLEGRSEGELVRAEIPFGELGAIAIGRRREDRLEGHPTLLVERPGHATLRIAGVGQAWIVSELVERLTSLRGEWSRARHASAL